MFRKTKKWTRRKMMMMMRMRMRVMSKRPNHLQILVAALLGVSKNRGTPKWMVYNGKPY